MYIDAVGSLGEHETQSQPVKEVLEEYVCRLYGEKNPKYASITHVTTFLLTDYNQAKIHFIYISIV